MRLAIMLTQNEQTDLPKTNALVALMCFHTSRFEARQYDTSEYPEGMILYDQLLKINYSPSVAPNRIYALYKVNGTQAALDGAEKLSLEDNHFYYVLLGDLYSNADPDKAKIHWEKAWSLAKIQAEKELIQQKINGVC